MKKLLLSKAEVKNLLGEKVYLSVRRELMSKKILLNKMVFYKEQDILDIMRIDANSMDMKKKILMDIVNDMHEQHNKKNI